MQVTEELKRAAMRSQEVEDQHTRLQVDQKRLDLQLSKAQEGGVCNAPCACLLPCKAPHFLTATEPCSSYQSG